MKIDFQYIKDLLDVVLDHDHPDFKITHEDIKPLWDGDDEEKINKFVFHMEILEDQGLIESSTSFPGVGFTRTGEGRFSFSIKPLRLTAQGHQFAADLAKPGVFEQLKTSFKDAGPAETVKIVFALGKKALEKRLSSYMEQ